MDFSLSKRRRAVRRKVEYGSRLQMYESPPQGSISTTELYQVALDRLSVLRAVYSAGVRFSKNSEEYQSAVMGELRTRLPLRANLREESDVQASAKEEERRKDHVSHFILRMAFCRTEDSRRWFCDTEKELLRLRLEENPEEVRQFLSQFQVAGEGELVEREEKIRQASHLVGRGSLTIFKVPFTEALELVRGRRVYLEGGIAWVPHTELVPIVTGMFRGQLSASLVRCARALPSAMEDERLGSLLKELNTADQADPGPGATAGSVSIAELPKLSKSAFPPCMRHLYETFTTAHHIKHGARLQLCLFLKGLGLGLEEVRGFFRAQFTHHMDSETYSKSGHDYMVRHLFGKEGKRQEKKPYGCLKIITGSPPGAGDCHGCPFKHMDRSHLESTLLGWKVPRPAIREMQSLVEGHHYQIACTKYFEVTQGKEAKFGLNHPNQYFVESVGPSSPAAGGPTAADGAAGGEVTM